jgi:hypothetical protein
LAERLGEYVKPGRVEENDNGGGRGGMSARFKQGLWVAIWTPVYRRAGDVLAKGGVGWKRRIEVRHWIHALVHMEAQDKKS